MAKTVVSSAAAALLAVVLCCGQAAAQTTMIGNAVVAAPDARLRQLQAQQAANMGVLGGMQPLADIAAGKPPLAPPDAGETAAAGVASVRARNKAGALHAAASGNITGATLGLAQAQGFTNMFAQAGAQGAQVQAMMRRADDMQAITPAADRPIEAKAQIAALDKGVGGVEAWANPATGASGQVKVTAAQADRKSWEPLCLTTVRTYRDGHGAFREVEQQACKDEKAGWAVREGRFADQPVLTSTDAADSDAALDCPALTIELASLDSEIAAFEAESSARAADPKAGANIAAMVADGSARMGPVYQRRDRLKSFAQAKTCG